MSMQTSKRIIQHEAELVTYALCRYVDEGKLKMVLFSAELTVEVSNTSIFCLS